MISSILISAILMALLLVGCSSEESTPPNSSAADESSQRATPSPPQPAPDAAPRDDTSGLVIGQRAPEFELLDQHNQQRSLAEMLTSGNVALIFYRSGRLVTILP